MEKFQIPPLPPSPPSGFEIREKTLPEPGEVIKPRYILRDANGRSLDITTFDDE